MAVEVIMPQMGESIAEGTITRWLVEVGDRVERDQPLLEISTDKVDAEIPSPGEGVLLERLYEEGATVEVDVVIGRIGSPDEAEAGAGEEAPDGAAPVEPESLERERTEPEPAGPAERSGTGDGHEAAPGDETETQRLLRRSSPVVRKIAREHGVDIGELEGTGIHGRVTKRDILQYLEQREDDGEVAAGERKASEEPAAAPETRATPTELMRPERPRVESRPAADRGELSFSVPAYAEGEPVEIESMSRVRRLTAAHMLYSQDTSAHVATVFEVDMSNVVAARNRAKRRFQESVGTKLTYMPFLFKAVVDGLRSFPKFNAAVDGTDIVYKKDINLGMAVAVDWGLLVPVIHHADQLNLVGLARAANDLADRARTKRLKPEEVQRGTFTVTNPGVFGSLFGTPIINQPQVAILCVGAIEKRPVVLTDRDGNDGIGIRSMAYLCLSYDHRLIDGADAEQFMVRVKETLTGSAWDELEPYR